MAETWTRARPSIEDQLSSIESALDALLKDGLEEEERASAERAAHKLAGSVGTFGFPKGSELARKLEAGLTAPVLKAHLPALSDVLRALRAEIAVELVVVTMDVPKEAKRNVLVVDADSAFPDKLILEGGSHDFDIQAFQDVAQARASLPALKPLAALVGLPDGYPTHDVLRLIELLSDRDPPVPVIVTTDAKSFADRVEVARAGAQGFLQKPISPREVLDAISTALMKTAAEDTTILAVDDNPLVLDTLRTFLEPRGMVVTGLGDPMGFWDVLAETAPDLLILDVDMPEVSGVELCRVVRNDPRWADLPVLFLTAHDDPSIVQRVFEAGADDYVQKPIVGPELIMRITNRLERLRLYRRLADIDHLTGVFTRRRSTQGITQLMRLADRYKQPLSVALLDLDHFKHLNDTEGHAAGDQVLRALGQLLAHTFRGEDIIARWGGEEFLVGMYGMGRADGVHRMAGVLESFRELDMGIVAAAPLTFSAGVAQYPDDGRGLQDLYRAADGALYTAKRIGRGRVLPVGWQPEEKGNG